MKILILNTHSVLNSGDAAIVFSQLRFLRGFFQDPEIKLVSRTPKLDKNLYSPLGIKILPPFTPAPSIFSGQLSQFQESIKNILALGSKIELAGEIKASDLVIASGGGYFWSNRRHVPGPMFFQNLLPVALAGGLKKPIVFFPQSFGPLFNSASGALLRKALSAPSVVKIFARESQSRDFIADLLGKETAAAKVEQAPDMAFLIDPEENPPSSTSLKILSILPDIPRPLAILTVREWNFPESQDAARKRAKKEDYLKALTEICLGFHRRFQGSILILPQVRGPGRFEDDRIISSELRRLLISQMPVEALPDIELPEAADPALLQACIAQADIMIAIRFHSAIFALNAGVPLFSIGYQPKSRETLKPLGLEAYSMPIGDINPAKALEILDNLLHWSPEQKSKLHSRVQEMKHTLTVKLESALLPFRET